MLLLFFIWLLLYLSPLSFVQSHTFLLVFIYNAYVIFLRKILCHFCQVTISIKNVTFLFVMLSYTWKR